MSGPRGLQLGDGRLRMVPWRRDATTAYLTLARGRLSEGAIDRCIQQLRSNGFRAALTAALAGPQPVPFLPAGFPVHARLHLLTRHVDHPPPTPPPRPAPPRRARPAPTGRA